MWNNSKRLELHGGIVANVIMVLTANAAALGDQQYIARSLGNWTPRAINNNDQIAGWASGDVGVLWDDGELIELGSLGGGKTWPESINNLGEVVGCSMTERITVIPFLYNDQGITGLDSLTINGDEANGINDLGQIVGGTRGLTGIPFLWENGVLTDLGIPPGHPSAQAEAINEAGQAVGRAPNPGGGGGPVTEAVLWENGQTIILPTLGGDHALAFDINDEGQIVGESLDAIGVVSAVMWVDRRAINLGVPPGAMATLAIAINNHGEVAVWTTLGYKVWDPYVWKDGGPAQAR